MKTILVLLSLLYAAAANTALPTGNNLVFHDDFEPASTQSPPPGWAMWGAAQHKVPANYRKSGNLILCHTEPIVADSYRQPLDRA